MTDLSVILPCFNAGATLPRALERLFAQDLPAGTFEIVVVDDGSTDGTAGVAHAARGPVPVRVVSQPNRGLAAARNAGAATAGGEVLLFLDPDVWAERALVAAHLRHYPNRKGLLAVQGRTSADPATLSTPFMRASHLMPDLTIRRREDLAPFHVAGRNFSVSRQGFTAAGGFDEGFAGYGWEDIEFALRFKRRGGRIILEPEARGLHHHHLSVEQAARRQYHAGRGAVYFWRRHGRATWLGLQLELHPAVLPLKRLVYRTGAVGAFVRRLRPWAEGGNHLWLCNECYNYLLWEAYYAGVFEALAAPYAPARGSTSRR
jgi:glycosyltransferase involved in cell wall biosynthesis